MSLLLFLSVLGSVTAGPDGPATTKGFVKVGDGQCNGGVGGSGEHKCLVGGTCNENGVPLAPPTEDGTGCPGTGEYLLCQEDASADRETCESACESDANCVGFMTSFHAAKGIGRCELHTKVVEFAATPLECYTFDSATSAFTLIGKGACRTNLVTVNGPQNGTHYGYMDVSWVTSLEHCEEQCSSSTQPCVGVEYHPTLSSVTGLHKCEVHFEELAANQMSVFECWALPSCRNSHTCPGGYKADAAMTQCVGAACTNELCCASSSEISAHQVDAAHQITGSSLLFLSLLLGAVSA